MRQNKNVASSILGIQTKHDFISFHIRFFLLLLLLVYLTDGRLLDQVSHCWSAAASVE
jgi:hypothetical protein